MNTCKIIIAFCIMLVVCGILLGAHDYFEKKRQGECVIIQPAVCVEGSISNVNGVFSSGPIEYRLWFKGKTSQSGEECEDICRVTEAQYNRWMNNG